VPVLERAVSPFVPLTPAAIAPSDPLPRTFALEGTVPDVARIGEIAAIVGTLTATWRPAGLSLWERRWERIAYPHPILVEPLGEVDGRYVPDGERLLVAGHDLSLGGLSFEHDVPLPHRFVALSFPMEPRLTRAIVAQLTWCRFTRSGLYDSGGRFLRTIEHADLEPPR
jgi:hypothetical protein